MKCDIQWSEGWASSMTQCVCGDVFQASGTCSEVREKEQAWRAQHADCVERKREGTKTFWMSFCDAGRPDGQRFLGACIIDVSAAEADEAAIDVALRFPFAQADSEWLAAATAKAHRLKCNPGGEIAFAEIPSDHLMLAHYERGVLMDRATVEEIDGRIESAVRADAVDPHVPVPKADA